MKLIDHLKMQRLGNMQRVMKTRTAVWWHDSHGCKNCGNKHPLAALFERIGEVRVEELNEPTGGGGTTH